MTETPWLGTVLTKSTWLSFAPRKL
jgi:hypothetical protein